LVNANVLMCIFSDKSAALSVM